MTITDWVDTLAYAYVNYGLYTLCVHDNGCKPRHGYVFMPVCIYPHVCENINGLFTRGLYLKKALQYIQ